MLANLRAFFATAKLNVTHWVDQNKKGVSLALLFLLALCFGFGFYLRIPGLLFLLIFLNLKDSEILQNLKNSFEDYKIVKNFKNTWKSDQDAMAYHKKKDFPFLSRVTGISFYSGPFLLIVLCFYDIDFYVKILLLSIFVVLGLLELSMSIYIIWFCNPFTQYKGLMTSGAIGRACQSIIAIAGIDFSMGEYVNAGTNVYNRTMPGIKMPDGTHFGGRGYALDCPAALDHDKTASMRFCNTSYNIHQYRDANGVVSMSDIDVEVKANLVEVLRQDNAKGGRLKLRDFERFGVSKAEFDTAKAKSFRTILSNSTESDL